MSWHFSSRHGTRLTFLVTALMGGACLDTSFRTYPPGFQRLQPFGPHTSCMVQGASQVLHLDGAVEHRTATWSSSDSTILAVTQAGLVTARGPGSALISATAGPLGDSAHMMVTTGLVSFVIDDGHET